MSLIANITVYLNKNYNLSGIFLVNVINIWNGFSNIASLAGAFVSDAYLGKFRTLLLGSISSLLVRNYLDLSLLYISMPDIYKTKNKTKNELGRLRSRS